MKTGLPSGKAPERSTTVSDRVSLTRGAESKMASRGTVGTNIFISEDIQGLCLFAKCGDWLYAFETGSKTAKKMGLDRSLTCRV